LVKNAKYLEPSPQTAWNLEMQARAYEAQAEAVTERGDTALGTKRTMKRIKLCCYDWLGDDSRVYILKYLAPVDLSEACLVSAQFRRDCFHPSLPDMVRQETFALSESFGLQGRRAKDIRHLRRLLTGLARRASFSRSVTSLKIAWSSSDNLLSKGRELQGKKIRKGIVTKGVSVLILPTSSSEEAVELVLSVVVPLLPDLRHLDCSPDSVPESKHWTLAFDCVTLQFHSLTRRRGRLVYDGSQLNRFMNVTNLYLDDSVLHYNPDHPVEDTVRNTKIFRNCLLLLERVSFKNLQYQIERERGRWGSIRVVPQILLINFVRGTPSLMWFRSDLTPENVAMLQLERPDLTFVS
jgi:hypothetical protein